MTQSEAGDSELDYDANYYLAELGAGYKGVTGTLGYEVLAADDGVGFQTPYATLHKFQGWADQFLAKPVELRLHPADFDKIGVEPGTVVRLVSERDHVMTPARPDTLTLTHAVLLASRR